VNPDTNIHTLIDALHEHADGLFADTAAVDLIVGHDVWLRRPQFQRFIHSGRWQASGVPFSHIRWRAAVTALDRGHLPCSSSEADILRIAASLGANIPLRLRHVLGRLDRRNVALVTDAITTANGA
jgi:hypothetical protein